MRKNNKQNNLLTKDYLDKKLKSFATKNDLKRFATKEDLKNSIERVMKYIDFKLAPIEEFRKKFEQFQNQVITTLDWIVRKLEKYDQEYLVMSNKYSETTDKLENHEQRITILEKKVIL